MKINGYVVEFFKSEEESSNHSVCKSPFGYWTGKKIRFAQNENVFFPFCTPGVEFGSLSTDGKTKIYKRKKDAVLDANELMKQVHDTIYSYEIKKVSCRTIYQYKL